MWEILNNLTFFFFSPVLGTSAVFNPGCISGSLREFEKVLMPRLVNQTRLIRISSVEAYSFFKTFSVKILFQYNICREMSKIINEQLNGFLQKKHTHVMSIQIKVENIPRSPASH